MSVKALTWAFAQKPTRPVDKLVLLAMADWANDAGSCFPSRKLIADRALCSVDTVDRSIKRLTTAGLLSKAPRDSARGGLSSNEYRLAVGGEVAAETQHSAPPSRKMRPRSKPQNAATPAADNAATLAAQAAATGTVTRTVTSGSEDNNARPDADTRRAGGLEELPGLNGSTALIVTTFAGWLNALNPDIASARRTIGDALALYGEAAVRDGFAELKADIADGKLRVPSVKSFYGYVRHARERGAKRRDEPKRAKFSDVLDDMAKGGGQ